MLHPISSTIIKTLTHVNPKITQVSLGLTNAAQYPWQNLTSHLQKCTNQTLLNQIHAQMVTTGLIHHPPSASKLVASFASVSFPGSTSVACSIAGGVYGLDTYTWNTVVRGYLDGNEFDEAFLVYSHVRRNVKVDTFTLLFVVKACGFMPVILQGKQVHAEVYKLGFLSELIIQTALLNMYGLFGELKCVQQVFDETPQRDVVMWNSLVTAFVQQNCLSKTLGVLSSMVCDNFKPNGVTVASILSCCSSYGALREGKVIHGYVVKNHMDNLVFVCNALIDLYAKCQSLLHARLVFHMMPIRNAVSWTSMINGFSNNNRPNEALTLFKEMESENIRPDEITMLGVVSMCSKLGSCELGDWIDNYVEENQFDKKNTKMANALMNMHAKCGNIKKACQIFDGIVEKTLVSWTSIIDGLGMHGHGMEALIRFCQMQSEGLKPDGVVFISILTACSRAGLVDEAQRCFKSMIEDNHIEPWMEHYGCLVDLLCKAGLVNEAFEFVEKMPIEPDMVVWRMLLGACQSQGNVNLATQVMNSLRDLVPENSEGYVLLSNFYAAVGEWDHVKGVRKEMNVRGAIKHDPGFSSMEVN